MNRRLGSLFTARKIKQANIYKWDRNNFLPCTLLLTVSTASSIHLRNLASSIRRGWRSIVMQKANKRAQPKDVSKWSFNAKPYKFMFASFNSLSRESWEMQKRSKPIHRSVSSKLELMYYEWMSEPFSLFQTSIGVRRDFICTEISSSWFVIKSRKRFSSDPETWVNFEANVDKVWRMRRMRMVFVLLFSEIGSSNKYLKISARDFKVKRLRVFEMRWTQLSISSASVRRPVESWKLNKKMTERGHCEASRRKFEMILIN